VRLLPLRERGGERGGRGKLSFLKAEGKWELKKELERTTGLNLLEGKESKVQHIWTNCTGKKGGTSKEGGGGKGNSVRHVQKSSSLLKGRGKGQKRRSRVAFKPLIEKSTLIAGEERRGGELKREEG